MIFNLQIVAINFMLLYKHRLAFYYYCTCLFNYSHFCLPLYMFLYLKHIETYLNIR